MPGSPRQWLAEGREACLSPSGGKRLAQLLLLSSCPGLPRGGLWLAVSQGGTAPVLLLLSWGALSSWRWAKRCTGPRGLPSTGLWDPGLPCWLWLQPGSLVSHPEWRCLSRAAVHEGPAPTPACGGSWGRLADVLEPDLGPGVPFQYQIGRICIRSKGLG